MNMERGGSSRVEQIALCFALFASITWFFAQVGAMAEEGIQGAFDPDLVSMMWSSSIGDVTLVRIIGFAVAFVTLFFISTTHNNHFNLQRSILLVTLIALAFSFTLVGHVSSLGKVEKVLLMIHVLAMAWWFGALYPLKRACSQFDNHELHDLMTKFGQQARFIVGVLLIAGLGLAYSLVGSFEALFQSRYGQVLNIKLILVSIILVMALRHKYRLVPQLKKLNGGSILKRSIAFELAIAFVIVCITAGLTSLVGPRY
jgi:putative copper resistance protein D